MLKVGHKAPDFEASAFADGEIRTVRSSDYRGRWLIVVFYPLDFTFVCPTELLAFAHETSAFDRLGASVVAISVDSVYSHKAWVERDLNDVRYPIVSDITKTIARDFGVLDEDHGVALRGTFIIDPEGIVQYQVVSALNLGRSTEETIRTLEALRTGELCPANWRPGGQTLGRAS